MNNSYARVTAQRAIFDAGDIHRPGRHLSQTELMRAFLVCVGMALLVLPWLIKALR